MAGVNSTISMIMLNVTGLNIIQPKSRDYETRFIKPNPTFCCL